MSTARAHVELPPELQAFAEERVRAGEFSTVEEVVVAAVEKQRLASLRSELDAGIAELDAGKGVVTTPTGLMAEISAELGLDD